MQWNVIGTFLALFTSGNIVAAQKICYPQDPFIQLAHVEPQTYFVCEDGIWKKKNCPLNAIFNPASQTCEYDKLIDERIKRSADSVCEKQNGVYVKINSGCRKYYRCRNWRATERKCPDGQLFNDELKICDWKELFTCKENAVKKSLCRTPNGSFLKPKSDCRLYYRCTNGEAKEMACPFNELFNEVSGECEWKELVECKDNTKDDVTTTISPKTKKPITKKLTPLPTRSEPETVEPTTEDVRTTSDGGSESTSSQPLVTSVSDVTDVEMTTRESDITVVEGTTGDVDVTVAEVTTGYDEVTRDLTTGESEVTKDVSMGRGEITEKMTTAAATTPEEEIFVCPSGRGNFQHRKYCFKYYACKNGQAKLKDCPDGSLFSNEYHFCYDESEVDCGTRQKPAHMVAPQKICNPQDPYVQIASSQPQTYFVCEDGIWQKKTCPENEIFNPTLQICEYDELIHKGKRICHRPDDRFVRPGSDCRQYYKCSNGWPLLETCPYGHRFEETSHQCEHEQLVLCNEEKGTDSICAERSGVYMKTNSSCQKFYRCRNWRAIEMSCPLGQLFDDELKTCDWEDLVNCKEKEVRESLCRRPDGYFLKPGSDCKRYYRCTNGKAHEMACPFDELFNEVAGECEWRELVDCRDSKKDYTSTSTPITETTRKSSTQTTAESTTVSEEETTHAKITSKESTRSTIPLTTTTQDTTAIRTTLDETTVQTIVSTSELKTTETELPMTRHGSTTTTLEDRKTSSTTSGSLTTSVDEKNSTKMLTKSPITEEKSKGTVTQEKSTHPATTKTKKSTIVKTSTRPTTSKITTRPTASKSTTKPTAPEISTQPTETRILTHPESTAKSEVTTTESIRTRPKPITFIVTSANGNNSTEKTIEPVKNTAETTTSIEMTATEMVNSSTLTPMQPTVSKVTTVFATFHTLEETKPSSKSNYSTQSITFSNLESSSTSSVSTTEPATEIKESSTTIENLKTRIQTTTNIMPTTRRGCIFGDPSCKPDKVLCPERSGLFPHPDDKTIFLHCDHWKPYIKECPAGLHFHPKKKSCQWPKF